MKKLLRNTKISIFTCIFLLIMFITGNFKTGILSFIILLIHELGHILVIVIKGYEVRKLTIHPYGCSIELMNSYIRNYFDDFLISIAGPLMYFIGNMIIDVLGYYSVFSISYINYLHLINLNICLFNCLPFLPLDGGRCLYDFISILMNERVGFIATRFVSIIVPILLISKVSLWFKLFFIYIIYNNIIEMLRYQKIKSYKMQIDSITN